MQLHKGPEHLILSRRRPMPARMFVIKIGVKSGSDTLTPEL